MKTLKNILKLAMIPILSNLNGCGDENQKLITKTVGKDYVKFYDHSGLVYIDLEKDDSLDIFYNTKDFPLVTAIKIVDNAYETENDSKIINRKGKKAMDLQKQFEDLKKRYDETSKYKKWEIKNVPLKTHF